jgi:hypothetical protein
MELGISVVPEPVPSIMHGQPHSHVTRGSQLPLLSESVVSHYLGATNLGESKLDAGMTSSHTLKGLTTNIYASC